MQEDKVRMNFTLTPATAERLRLETNKSGTVEEALKLYFNHKDTVKRIISLADRLEDKLNPTIKQPELAQPQRIDDRYEWRELLPGLPKARVDTLNDTYWDPVAKQWLPLENI